MRTDILQRSARAGQLTAFAVVLVLAAAVATGWWYAGHRSSPAADQLTVYYTRLDGSTEASWSVSVGPAKDPRSVAFYAATQAIAGPPSGIDAVRFPNGTRVRSVEVNGSTAIVDLSKEVDGLAGGSFAETAAFKALVWTMTDLPGIAAVVIRVDGARISTIPGGHFELDEPLARSSW